MYLPYSADEDNLFNCVMNGTFFNNTDHVTRWPNYDFFFINTKIINLLSETFQLTKSNANHAYLFNTDLDSEGFCACEVSTEGPSFSTVRTERQMKIYGKWL